jgi:NAD-dependent deacetylase
MNKEIEKLKNILEDSNNIVFFGGAGVSTESGIPDFRSADGLYKNNPETILSHSFFIKNPEIFFKFYKKNLIFSDAKPNNAHNILAKMEKDGKLKWIITQNIDALHQKAGSKNVFELHGSISKNYCMKCGKLYSLEEFMNIETLVPRCKCGGIIKPDVVLYEEELNYNTIDSSVRLLQNADILIVGGTSLMVNPAASLINYFNGSCLALINMDSTPYDSRADIIIREKIGETFLKLYK